MGLRNAKEPSINRHENVREHQISEVISREQLKCSPLTRSKKYPGSPVFKPFVFFHKDMVVAFLVGVLRSKMPTTTMACLIFGLNAERATLTTKVVVFATPRR